jgi:hypothetical protein
MCRERLPYLTNHEQSAARLRLHEGSGFSTTSFATSQVARGSDGNSRERTPSQAGSGLPQLLPQIGLTAGAAGVSGDGDAA